MKPEVPLWLRERLPTFERFFCRNEADYYGAGWEIARALGLRRLPYSDVGWLHGWPFLELTSPRQLVSSLPPEARYLVPRKEHVVFLHDRGFGGAKAVGLPICYAGGEPVERRPNTLLVMPAHTTHVHVAGRWDEDGYARLVAGLRNQFDAVVACVHSSCYRSGIWINAFRRAGIPCVSGARTNDRNSLRAQQVLFRSFEFVTGNQIGSWAAYSAAYGAKPSLWGPVATYAREDYASDRFMQANPDLLERYLSALTEDGLRRRFGWLFCDPWHATGRTEWGRREIGLECLRAPCEVASLLRWDDRALQRRYWLRELPRTWFGRVGFYRRHGARIAAKRARALLGRRGWARDRG